MPKPVSGPPGAPSRTGGPGAVPTPTSKTGKTGENSFRDLGNDAIEFIKQALARTGDPSVTGLKNEPGGGMNPAGPFDCSSLVAVSLETMGISAPRTSEEQAAWVKSVPGGVNGLQPGDLIFEVGRGSPPPGHVVIYLGQGLVIAADEGGNVHIRAFDPATEGVMSVGRPPGLEYNPGATGAQTYAKQLDRLVRQVQLYGPISSGLGGIKLPPASGPLPRQPLPRQTFITNNYGNPAIGNPRAAAEYSAYEQTANALAAWGLDDPALIKEAHQRAMAGEDYRQIVADIRKTPQYQAAFPGMAERVKEGLPPMSEAQYITYQNYMMGLANRYALPHGFITKAEIGKLVAQNVSVPEFNARLEALSGVATKADPNVRAAFDKFYGVKRGLGALTAYFANPKRATDLLTQQAEAAQLSAQSGESGLGALNKAQSQHLAQLEYTQHLAPGTMRGAIDTASNWNYLRAGAPGSVAPKATTSQLLGAEVPGYTREGLAADRSAVKSAESARESFLQSGGGFEATPRGAVGVGGASTEGRGSA